MSRTGSRVIPSGWEQYHRPVLDTTRTATITFRRTTGPSVMDSVTGSSTQPTTVVFTGTCRIQEHQARAHSTVAGAELVTTHAYQVSLDVAADLQKNDVGTVDTCSDTTLVGRELRVDDLQHGSLLFERTVICIDDLGVA
jgi:uncharacterized protein DUF6093